MEVAAHSDETMAVWAAASPRSYLRKKGSKIKTTSLTTEQRDPNNRIILNPITDENWKLVGLAGMIVDEKYFKTRVLPDAIKSALPKFEDGDKEELQVVVRDGRKHQVLPAGKKASTEHDRARRSFQFIFTDWMIALQGNFASPEKWVRVNFTYNMTPSAVLALVLLAGIGLFWRGAIRAQEITLKRFEQFLTRSVSPFTPMNLKAWESLHIASNIGHLSEEFSFVIHPHLVLVSHI